MFAAGPDLPEVNVFTYNTAFSYVYHSMIMSNWTIAH